MSQVQSSQTAGALEQELAVEQAHVDRVYTRLGEATRSAQQVATAGRSLFRSDRGSYVREEDGTGLYERDVFAFQAAKRLAVLDAEHEGLVFGRLDRTDGEVRYVGRIGVRDADYEPLVIDWRAPAAEPFYRATPTDPMEVIRRRVLRCQGNRVVGIEDDLLDSDHGDTDLVVIGEGALMAALSRARGHTMRDIVATIQIEQDEAIRAPYSGFTMISGGPGTGKTVVALHRAAFLLYSNRRRFESGGVLVVGPSRVFMNYIERVLPSLGEESITLRSIGSVASDVVRITGDRVDDAATAAVKGSPRMVKMLRRLVAEPLLTQPLELRVIVQGNVLVLPADALTPIRRDVLAHHKLNAGREAAERSLLTALWRIRPSDVDLEREEFDDLVTDLATLRDVPERLVADRDRPDRAGPARRPRARTPAVRFAALHPGVRAVGRELRPPSAGSGRGVGGSGPFDKLRERELKAPERLDRRRRGPAGRAGRPARPGAGGDRSGGVALPRRGLRGDRGRHHRRPDVAGPGGRPLRAAPPDVRARPGRRGTGHHPDAVADVAAPGRQRQLDHRRRPRPELLARHGRGHPGHQRHDRHRPGPPLPDEHQLPQPGRGLRLRLPGHRRGLPGGRPPPGSPVDRGRAAAAGGRRVGADAHPDHRRTRPARGGRGHRRRHLPAGAPRRDPVRRCSRPTCRTPTGSPWSRRWSPRDWNTTAVLVVEPDEIVATSPGGMRSLYVALTRPTQRLVTLDARADADWRRSLG